jgi:hypothetical protein
MRNESPLPDSRSLSMSPPPKRQKTSEARVTKRQNKKAIQLAAERDGPRCVLTGSCIAEVAYIYPFHSLSHQETDKFGERHMFWSHLKNFWPLEKIAAWEAELFPQGLSEIGAHRVSNLLTLSLDTRVICGEGAFALKPISHNATTLKVQLLWQKKQPEAANTAMSSPH